MWLGKEWFVPPGTFISTPLRADHFSSLVPSVILTLILFFDSIQPGSQLISYGPARRVAGLSDV